MSTDLRIGPNCVIPGDELTVTSTHSSGPGGQNVNKVATKIELRYDLANSEALTPAQKARLRVIAGNRFDADGQLIITSQVTRNRLRNLVDARDKLADMVRESLLPPKPRFATKPTKSSQRNRVADKRATGDRKRARGTRPASDE